MRISTLHFTVCLALFSGCAVSETSRYFLRGDAAPGGCAVGTAGPSLRPQTAVDVAEARAFEELVASHVPDSVHIRGVTVDRDGDAADRASIVIQTVEGRLLGGRVVRLWYDEAGEGLLSAPRTTYAMACTASAARDVPPWIELGSVVLDGVGTCAIGMAGPTLFSDQREVAVEDARSRLAKIVEAQVDSIFTGEEGDVFRELIGVGATDAALAAVVDAEARAYVVDEDGDGPLGRAGMAYAVVCL